ncbi:hypothetical protein HDU98_005992 [Podochytrium sp. JEL0797]|nr:hypothetical protein HDU98_005992 [Podochytrium sp. JEL0797]
MLTALTDDAPPPNEIAQLFSRVDSFLLRKRQRSASGPGVPAFGSPRVLLGDMKLCVAAETRLFEEHVKARGGRVEFRGGVWAGSRGGMCSVEDGLTEAGSLEVFGSEVGSLESPVEDAMESRGEAWPAENPWPASARRISENDTNTLDLFRSSSVPHFGRFEGTDPFGDGEDDDPFAVSGQRGANEHASSTPFSLKSAFKVKQNDNSTIWSPFGKSSVIDFTKEIDDSFQQLDIRADPFTVDDPFTSTVTLDDATTATHGESTNLLDETFDISGHNFSPSNSGSSGGSRTSEISNLSIKPDEFILRPSNPMPVTPTTPRTMRDDVAVTTPRSEMYKRSHPKGTLGRLYDVIVAGGGGVVVGVVGGRRKGKEVVEEDFSKTPMSRYFAEKSCKLGGRLGELVDAEERPYFQTPKRDRYGRVVDMIAGTPPVQGGRVGAGGKGAVGKQTRKGAPLAVVKKPMYIRSPAMGLSRVNVKWDGGQTRGKGVNPNAGVLWNKPGVVGKPTGVQHKTRRVETPACRKPLYQAPPPRERVVETRKPVKSRGGVVPPQPPPAVPRPRVPVRAVKRPVPVSQQHQQQPQVVRKPFSPVTLGSRHILQELVLPNPDGALVPKPMGRKSIYIPPPSLQPSQSKRSPAVQRTYIRLHNASGKPAPFYITSTGGSCGTRDGKPCAFYASFKLECMKGVVPGRGVVDVEVKSTGVLRGVYLQSFRVFACHGSVPFTLRTVL